MRRSTPRVPDFTHAPLMSLASVLIPMLLMGASFVDLAVVDSTLPSICGCGLPAGEEQALDLSVYVHEWGVEVAGEDEALFGRVAIESDEHEMGALSELLADLNTRHPHETQVLIVPTSKVPYERLVRVMDATRSLDGEELYPHPVLVGGLN